jgi:hypothetical protein
MWLVRIASRHRALDQTHRTSDCSVPLLVSAEVSWPVLFTTVWHAEHHIRTSRGVPHAACCTVRPPWRRAAQPESAGRTAANSRPDSVRSYTNRRGRWEYNDEMTRPCRSIRRRRSMRMFGAMPGMSPARSPKRRAPLLNAPRASSTHRSPATSAASCKESSEPVSGMDPFWASGLRNIRISV